MPFGGFAARLLAACYLRVTVTLLTPGSVWAHEILPDAKEVSMRNLLFRHASACGVLVAAFATGLIAAEAAPLGGAAAAYSPLVSQDQSGFGYPIVFAEGSYTPPAIFRAFRRPLASQDQAGFGYAISFSGSRRPPSEMASAH
jgi:hypothetical protein